MGISDTTNRVAYAGDGSSTVFSFAHEFFAQADLKVYLYQSSAIQAQTLNTHYTIGGTPNLQGIYTQGGNVITACSIPIGTLVVITRDPALIQNYALLQNGNINSVALVQQLDYLTLITQRLQDKASRSVKLRDGSAQNFSPDLPLNLNASSVIMTDGVAGSWVQGPQADQIFGAQSSAISAAASAISAAASAAAAAAATVGTGSSIFWAVQAQSSALSASNSVISAGSSALSASNSAASASTSSSTAGSSALSASNSAAISSSSALSASNSAASAGSSALSASNSAVLSASSANQVVSLLPLSTANGGTGIVGPYSQYAVITASSATQFTSSVVGGNDQPFVGNAGAAPTFKPLNVASGSSVTGILGTTNGGTGVAAALVQYGVIYASSATQMATVPSAAAGQVLTANGSSAPSFQSVSVTNSVAALKTANYNAVNTDAFIPVGSSGFTVNLYGVTGNNGKIITIKKQGTNTGNITIAGSSATIDGVSSLMLTNPQDFVTLQADTANWNIINSRISALVHYSDTNAYGSTNTQIRKYKANLNSSVIDNNCWAITNDAVNAFSVTINLPGVYSFSYTELFGSAEDAGLSLNSGQLTTAITSVNSSAILGIGTSVVADQPFCVTWAGPLKAGDVVRPHTRGAADSGTVTGRGNFVGTRLN